MSSIFCSTSDSSPASASSKMSSITKDVGAGQMGFERGADVLRRAADDHDLAVGQPAHFFHEEYVGGLVDRQRQAVADFEQRQDGVAVEELPRSRSMTFGSVIFGEIRAKGTP